MEKGKPSGEIIQYSPYGPPKEKRGKGIWVVEERHAEKRYPIMWRWVPKADLDPPPEEPLDKSLLTRAEKMEHDFEKAGYPTRGSQPVSDFKPDE